MNKYEFWGKKDRSVGELAQHLKNNYTNKYYNLWMEKFEWTGLDPEMETQEKNFIMRKFWADGTVACRQVPNTGLLAFAPWAGSQINLYGYPEVVNLVNTYNTSTAIIPNTPQVVNKDVVIGWCMPNHKGIVAMVNYYIERIVTVEMVINTNLQLQKMPFLIGVSEANKKTMDDIVKRILNNEVVVFADLEELQNVQSLVTQTPYIIDKLRNYECVLENELLTALGIDNNGEVGSMPRVTVDQVNSGNDLINSYNESIVGSINDWLKDIERVFGRKITIKTKVEPVESEHEIINDTGDKADEGKEEENND